MAQLKVYYEPAMELLTVFWQSPMDNQMTEELGEGIILIKNSETGQPIGMELLSYVPEDKRFDSVNVEIGTTQKVLAA